MIDDAALQRFQDLFRGRAGVHGRFTWNPARPDVKRATTIQETAGGDVFRAHLEGTGPGLGIVPIADGDVCWWGAIDVDDDGVDLQALAAAIDVQQLPLVLCRSKSGGAHLYVFLSEPIPAKTLRNKLKEFAEALHYTHNHDGRPVEFFPKQDHLRAGASGNWINLPYADAANTVRYAVEQSGDRLTLGGFLALAELRRVTPDSLVDTRPAEANPFRDGPPCLQALHDIGWTAGAKDNALIDIAIFYRLESPIGWEARVQEYNDQPKGPQKDAGTVKKNIGSVGKTHYAYMCDEIPIVNHCDKPACKRRRFGIGAFAKKARDAAMPELGPLAKVETDPPRWLLTVAGGEVELTSEELPQLTKVRQRVLERRSVLLPAMKSVEWDEIVQDLLVRHTVIAAPDDAGALGQLWDHLDTFLDQANKTQTRDQILSGLPFREAKRVLFRSRDLIRFLESRNFRAFGADALFMALRRLGLEQRRVWIKDTNQRVWVLPAPEVLSAPLDVPAIPAAEF